VSREVILYTRKNCGLCDETADELRHLQRELGFTFVAIDIDDDAELRAEYNDIIPVVAIGERVIAHAPVDAEELGAALRAALG
jgi:thiol-disulfide isomerase/thioredoxin